MLLRCILPTINVILDIMWLTEKTVPCGEKGNSKKKQMAQALLNNQGKDQVEASIQELREAIVEVFPPDVSWSKTELYSQGKKKKNIKKLYPEFKRHTVFKS